jgi:hypothetical protein
MRHSCLEIESSVLKECVFSWYQRAKYNAANVEITPRGTLDPKWGATPVKSSGAGVVELAIAAGSVGVAGAIAGEVAVLRGK